MLRNLNPSTGVLVSDAPTGEPAVSEMDHLRAELSAVLGVALTTEDDDAHLFELGLQSVQLMRVLSGLRRRGVRAGFAEFAEEPTLSAWHALITAGTPDSEKPAATSRPAIVADDEPFPLTKVQQAYWIGRRDDQPLGGVGCHAYLELAAATVDTARLEAAVRALLAAHPMLRAGFGEDGTQRVLPASRWPGLRVSDFTGLSAEEADRAVENVREGLSHRRLDVAAGEVLDVRLSLLPGGARVHVNVDLLVADVHSIRLLLDDLAALYADPGARVGSAGTFARYLAERAMRPSADLDAAKSYWQARIPTLPSGPALPLAVEPADVVTTRFSRRQHTLTPAEWELLRARARDHGITPSVMLATAFAEVLARWSGEQRFLLNLPLFDREADPEVERIIADFTNLVLLEIDLGAAAGFAGRAAAVQERLHRDVGHSGYSGVDVLRDFVRSDGDTPRSAPVVFACNLDAPLVTEKCAERLGDLAWMVSQTPQVWLDHQVYATREGGLLLAWDAVDELFPPGLLDAMMAAYLGLLRDLTAADWALPPVLPLPDAQARTRERVNAPSRVHSGLLLHDGFFAQAKAFPDAPALIDDHETVTYAELADRALRIAGSVAARGVGRGDAVVVSAPKGADQIAAVLGVLAAGAAYVPVGVDQPVERRASVLGTSGAKLVLDAAGQRTGAVPVLTITEARESAILPAPVAMTPDEPAYVIFTSGSTGVPKGVELTHRAALNTVEDVNERWAVGQGDRVLAVSALDFDLSVWDVFGLLGAGGALVLVEEGDRRDARRWLDLCERHEVTVWNSVPALMDMLLSAADDRPLPSSLRLALLSGDWIGLALPGRLAAASGGRCALVALGGATEAAIWSNAFPVTEVRPGWRSIPYGAPLRNQRYRVVDPARRDCPDWVIGELWIGGDGVATGYRGSPELTAERFVIDRGERWYRTGDLGRFWADGTIEFLGRSDHQVKLNGHRVELGEVEAALRAHPAVAQAVVAVGPNRSGLAAAIVERRRPAETVAEVERRETASEAEQNLVGEVIGSGAEAAATWLEHLRNIPQVPQWTTECGLAVVVEELLRARPLLRSIARGEAEPAALSHDPVLSPEGFADTVFGERLCETVVAARGARVAEWDALGGRTAVRVLDAVEDPESADYTVIAVTEAAAVAAAERLGAASRRATVARCPAGVPDALLHSFDIAITGSPDPATAAMSLALLVRNGGRAIVTANIGPSPLARLIDGLAGHTGERPDARAWVDALAEAGLGDIRVGTAAPDGTVLIGAIRPDDAPGVDADGLGEWLADRLPTHMIPRSVLAWPRLPLSANGKVDRRRVERLLATEADDATGAEPVQGPLEETMAELWAEVLGTGTVGRTVNFFAAGGDSLTATKLVARIRARLGADLPMRTVLRAPTIAAMAAVVEELGGRIAEIEMENGLL